MTYDLISTPAEATPLIYTGPEGNPNGTFQAGAGTIVLATDGNVFVKTVGSDEFGWTQITGVSDG